MNGRHTTAWLPVRRAITDLSWSEQRTDDLVRDWTGVLEALLDVRRTLGPIPAPDPMALLASSASGASRASGKPIEAPSLEAVRSALRDVATQATQLPPGERETYREDILHTAYELAHWVRIRHPSADVQRWLLAGESALDGAIHARTAYTATGLALARWQAALADVHVLRRTPAVQYGIALGHDRILRTAQQSLRAMSEGGMPDAMAHELREGINQMRRAHRATASELGGERLPMTPANQAILLRLGEALLPLTQPSAAHDQPHEQLDALLRSGFGQAALVAQVSPTAHQQEAVAGATVLEQIGRQHLYNPTPLRWRAAEAPTQNVLTLPELPRSGRSQSTSPVSARIAVGADLDKAEVEALCRQRDRGIAAASADPADPPQLLAEIPSTQWPHVVIRGREAVADLVASVTPMVYALLRGTRSSNDLRSELLLNLVSAARRFQPDRTEGSSWPAYAWGTLSKVRLRGVDEVGGPFRRLVGQPTSMLPFLDALAAPDARLLSPEQGSAIAEIAEAIDSLPPVLRRTLLESMQGRNSVTTAERLSVDPSTVRRRLNRARDIVGQRIGYHPDRGTDIRP